MWCGDRSLRLACDRAEEESSTELPEVSLPCPDSLRAQLFAAMLRIGRLTSCPNHTCCNTSFAYISTCCLSIATQGARTSCSLNISSVQGLSVDGYASEEKVFLAVTAWFQGLALQHKRLFPDARETCAPFHAISFWICTR